MIVALMRFSFRVNKFTESQIETTKELWRSTLQLIIRWFNENWNPHLSM